MRRKWIMECTADFADKTKNAAMDELFRKHAVQVQAAALLLGDAQAPEVICYSDDFFVGRKQIDIMLRRQTPDSEPADEETSPDSISSDEEGVSDEMLSAMRERGR